MPLLLGIDEAGYGPTLGPLVVAATHWRVTSADASADLWKALRSCTQRAGGRASDTRLTIDDSKRAFDRKKGLSTLERPVLAFALAAGAPCDCTRTFLGSLGAAALGEMPWEQECDAALPADPATGSLQATAERLAREQQRAAAVCTALRARVVLPQRFNHRLDSTRNKASVLLEPLLDLLHEGLHCSDEEVFAFVDRLGGRADYRRLLMDAFPQRTLQEVSVNADRSAYTLMHAGGGPAWHVAFVVEADQHHMPVALASMTAKYVRELLMQRFNAYWQALLPELAPTAGYHTDAQRFLREIAPLLPQVGLSADSFVRRR